MKNGNEPAKEKLSGDSVCKRPGSGRPCGREVWKDGDCICHSPENGRDDETAREVWRLARIEAAGQCRFAGWHFPADPDGNGFENIVFATAAYFWNATFTGDTSFWNATFMEVASFTQAMFITGAVEFTRATFIGDASFPNATFTRNADFGKARFKGTASFNNATFTGGVDFTQATFIEDASFSSATSTKDTSFFRATFAGDAYFGRATFGGRATFHRARIGGRFFLDGSHEARRQFTRTLADGEDAFRLAKLSAQNVGDYAAAGGYHYLEQSAIDTRMRKDGIGRFWKKRFWQARTSAPLGWLYYLIGRGIFGYGEKLWRVVAAAAVVVFVCAGAFTFVGVRDTGRNGSGDVEVVHSFTDALYFSVVTFTTLGYGDMQPLPDWRWLAATEAALGACLIAAFVVVLSRKFVR